MVKIRKDIKIVKVKDLKEYSKNNKIHPEEQISLLVQMIDKFGFTTPLLIDKDNVLIAGHGRKLAAEKLGLKELPCLIIDDLSENEIKALRIADNRIGELAETQMFNVKEEFDYLKDSGLDFLTGYTDEDFIDFNEIEEPKEVKEDDFEVPDEIKTDIKRGDIIKLGNHRLMCGSSTEIEDVEKLTEQNKLDMCFTSPPYNVGKNAKLNAGMKSKTGDNKYIETYNDDNIKWKELLIKSLCFAKEVSKFQFYNIQHLAGNKILLLEFLYEMRDYLVDTIIWKKSNTAPAMAECVLNSQFEYIFVFSQNINPTRAINLKQFRGTVSNVIETTNNSSNEFSNIHAAAFPIKFIEFFINSFTNEKMGIYEPFGGTGTTLIACEQLNRQCYMMELDSKYCEVICQRWEKLTGNKREVLDGN